MSGVIAHCPQNVTLDLGWNGGTSIVSKTLWTKAVSRFIVDSGTPIVLANSLAALIRKSIWLQSGHENTTHTGSTRHCTYSTAWGHVDQQHHTNNNEDTVLIGSQKLAQPATSTKYLALGLVVVFSLPLPDCLALHLGSVDLTSPRPQTDRSDDRQYARKVIIIDF